MASQIAALLDIAGVACNWWCGEGLGACGAAHDVVRVIASCEHEHIQEERLCPTHLADFITQLDAADAGRIVLECIPCRDGSGEWRHRCAVSLDLPTGRRVVQSRATP